MTDHETTSGAPRSAIARDLLLKLREARQALEVESLRVHRLSYQSINHAGRCGRELNAVFDVVDQIWRLPEAALRAARPDAPEAP